MKNLLRTGTAWLEAQRVEYCAEGAVYRRGDVEATVRATVARKIYETADDEGVLVLAEATDFLVPTGDLLLGGEAATPAPGDRIVWDGRTFAVAAPGPGMSPYEPADPYGRSWRIHTKCVEGEG